MDIDAEKNNIQSHIDKGNYHAGINLALSAMNACHREQDQSGVDSFIAVIKQIVDRLNVEFGSNESDS